MAIADFKGKSNNLNFIKWVASVLVIYSHAYAVTGHGTDPLSRLSDGQITFGGVAVAVFFFASGYFVTKSLLKRGSRDYWRSRAVRIYPMFALTVILTAFVLGPTVTALRLSDYFKSAETYRYLEYLVMIPRYALPGVFRDHPETLVNGSLWTLILEVICYIGLFIAYKAGLLKRKIFGFLLIPVFLAILLIFGLRVPFLFRFSGYFRPLFLFIAGMAYYLFADRIRLDFRFGLIALMLFVLLVLFGFFDLAMILPFPYLLSLAVFSKRQLPEKVGMLGNYSYTLYLFAFPVQQTFLRFFDEMSVLENTAFSAVTAFALAVIAYHFIENPISRKLLAGKN